MDEHLIGCIATGPCPSPTSHRRLSEAHTLWHRCLDDYQDPELFRTYLNAGIQALRNVTFAVQKEMRHIDGFVEWYEPWQDAMRRSPAMKWLVEARNRIVKEGDLTARSEIQARVVFDYFGAAAVAQQRAEEFDLKPIVLRPTVLATLEDIREEVADREIPQFVLDEAVVVLERRWVAEDFPSSELLNLLAYGFSFLASLVVDADVQFSATRHDPDLDPDTIGTVGSPYPAALRPFCMVSTHGRRTSHIRFRDGDPDVGGIAVPVEFDPDETARGIAKYGAPIHVIGARDARDYVEAYADLGERILATGEEHGWFHFYFRGPNLIYTEVVAARDKADKYALAQHVADMVRRLDVDGIVQISEIWMGKIPADGEQFVPVSEQANRTEALQIYAEISSGATRGLIVPFSRSAFGIVSIGQPFEENTPTNFLLPARAVWHAASRDATL